MFIEDWLKAEEAWFDNPLMNIDSDQMEIMVNDMHKTILHSAKYFHEQPSKDNFFILLFLLCTFLTLIR